VQSGTAVKMDTGDFILPDPRLLDMEELKALFLRVSREFTQQLAHSNEPNEVRQLEILHDYIKSIVQEIQQQDRFQQ
jgi:hypothetical protein